MMLKQKIRKSLSALFGALWLFSLPATALTEQAVSQWQSDIEHYRLNIVKRHINPFTQINERQFNKQLEQLKTNLADKTRYQVIIELMKIHHKIGDGHTSIPLSQQGIEIFPIDLLFFDRSVRVVKTSKEHKALLGAELVKIGGHPVEEVREKFRAIVPFVENRSSQYERVSTYMMMSALLKAFGIINDSEVAQFTFKANGKQFTLPLQPFSRSKRDKVMSESVFPRDQYSATQTGLFSNNSQYLWHQTLKNQTLYIRFERYPYMKTMNRFGEEALEVINKERLRHIIIDLRDNYGGDLYVGVMLARWLNLADSIDWQQGVYVLVGRKTYSAAMVNAINFRQLLNAKIVGELPGAIPTGFQDMDSFSLPHSNLQITYSKRRFNLAITEQNQVPLDTKIELNWQSFQQGNDQELQWVLKDIARR
ncbi:S41 family peptidase [Shewanella marina]|uniref:S41 family peptidase n=1 Tax=Shewanella marina TaxID=487319 RepID=UPI000684B12E|nr:S41 family peptidase [Shewanella marina]